MAASSSPTTTTAACTASPLGGEGEEWGVGSGEWGVGSGERGAEDGNLESNSDRTLFGRCQSDRNLPSLPTPHSPLPLTTSGCDGRAPTTLATQWPSAPTRTDSHTPSAIPAWSGSSCHRRQQRAHPPSESRSPRSSS